MDIREIVACACYCNDMHYHNDPPLWEDCGVEGLSISPAERARYYGDADHIIKELAKSGFQIGPSPVTNG